MTNGDPATGRRRPGGGRSGRRLGLGVGSREEGLNELGEAPPAYMPNPPKPPSDAGAEHVELMTYSQATGAVGTSRSPPTYGQDAPGGSTTTTGAGSGGNVERTSSEAEARGGVTGNAAVVGTSRGESPPRYGDVPSSGTAVGASVTAAAAGETNIATGMATGTGAGAGADTGLSTETGTRTGMDTDAHTDAATQPRSDANGATGTNEEEGRRDAEQDTTSASTATATEPTTTAAADTTAAPTAPITATADEPAPPPQAILPSS